MGFDDPTQQTDHAHLIQTLSAMMIQLNALQMLVHKDVIDGIDVSPTYHIPDMDAIRNGLAILEQMTRDMLYEVRAVSDDVPIEELSGVQCGGRRNRRAFAHSCRAPVAGRHELHARAGQHRRRARSPPRTGRQTPRRASPVLV